MALVDRVKNILLTPKTEWPKIAEEVETTKSIYIGYVMILAAIGPIAILVRGSIFGVTMAIMSYAIALGMTFLLALIVDALATTFGAEKNFIQSLKLVAYSCTALWVAGIFHLVPIIGGLAVLLASIYTFYTFFLGLPAMKKCPGDKAVAYTLVVVVCGFVVGAVLSGVLMSAMVGGSMMGMMR